MTGHEKVWDDLFSPLMAPSSRRASTRVRDSQRSKVYAAERRAFDGKEFGKFDLSLKDCEKLIAKVTSTAWFQKRWGKGWDILVRDGRGHRRATSSGARRGTITLPKWARCEWVILHEISHNVVTDEFYRSEAAPHGWEFCSTYLALVQHHLGKDAADRLKAEFKAGKVRYMKPRKGRTLTPEQAAANIARLAAAREAAAAKKAEAKKLAEDSDPIKVRLLMKGNFSVTHCAGVRWEIRDLTVGTLLYDGLRHQGPDGMTVYWRGDGSALYGWGSSHHLSHAGAARQFGEEMARGVAANRPGHFIELRIVGRKKRWRINEDKWDLAQVEVTEFRHDEIPVLAGVA